MVLLLSYLFRFLLFLFLFWLLSLGLWILCWITVVRMGIFVLFLILEGNAVSFLPLSTMLVVGLSCVCVSQSVVFNSSILAWRILWIEEPGGLQSIRVVESDTTEATWHACLFPLCPPSEEFFFFLSQMDVEFYQKLFLHLLKWPYILKIL